MTFNDTNRSWEDKERKEQVDEEKKSGEQKPEQNK